MDRNSEEWVIVRRQVIEEVRKGHWTVKELAERYEISRQSIYNWAKGVENEGWKALEGKSRAPKNHPNERITQQWESRILELKRRRKHLGARKILVQLRRQHPEAKLPSVATIGRLLARRGLSKPSRHRRAGPVAKKGAKATCSDSN